MPSAPTSIGPFQIERELGRGGMGVVYLARDTRLDRQVAIKALPDHLVDDPDRLARFQREAKTLASLNHPNIASIYGLEAHEKHQYLVLEYVEGETLADVLKRGPIPVDEALGIAKQITEALEAAHEKGVIHRDIKPGNVIITPEGGAKVLDFGLARTADGSPSSTSVGVSNDSPTLTTPHHPVHSPTIPGAIMGTAGYMSPEQARGKPVDKRSDIFSFGCVLYEMLSGARPFTGETVADALGATLHKELNLNLLPPNTPARIRELVTICLAKDRKNRLHDIGDARIEIDRAIAGKEWATAGVTGGTTRARFGPAVIAGALLGAIALVGIGWVASSGLEPSAPPPPPRADLFIPSRTDSYAQASDPVISPDGRLIVFGARSIDTGKWNLWLRPLDAADATPLKETEGGAGVFWSPDSRSIAFHADGKLWTLDVTHAGARRLVASERFSYGGSWGPDGTMLFAKATEDRGIARVPAVGGPVESVTALDSAAFERFHVFPRFLSDGERFIYLGVRFDPDQEVRTGQLYVARLGDAERTAFAPILSKAWVTETGWLVYVEDGVVKAAPFDERTPRLTGDPVVIADGAFYFRPYGESTVSVSTTGTIVLVPPGSDEQLVWFDESGKRLGTIGPKARFNDIRISPDGKHVAASVFDRRTSTSDILVFGVERPTTTRLTTDARWEGGAVWSHDGSTMYFSWDRSDAPEVYSIAADGAGPITPIYGPGSGGRIWMVSDVTPDGKWLLTDGTVDRLGREIRVVPLGGSGEATTFRSTPANERGAKVSPDGRWVAYMSDESGDPEVYLAALAGAGPRVQISERSGGAVAWSPGSDRVYYVRSRSDAGEESSGASAIMAVDLATPEAFASPPPPRVVFETPETIADFDITPDGKRFLVQLAPVDTPPIRVILNSLPSGR